MAGKRLIIIGGGINGLVLARELAAFYSITVLEGQERWGGRINSQLATDGHTVIEGGAEFIHGKLKHTMDLLDEAEISYAPIEGKMYRRQGGEWVEQDSMMEGWDRMLEAMAALRQDMTLTEFFDIHFPGEKNTGLRHQALKFAEGFDLADPSRASVMALYKEWTAEQDDNYRIATGYGSLVNYLVTTLKEDAVEMVSGDPVRQVDWEPHEVRAYTGSGKTYDADLVIVTIPVSTLARAGETFSINFTPPLDPQIRAAGEIGMGTIIKFVLEFDSIQWPDDLGFILSDETVPTWWSQLPGRQPILTGWLGGPAAAKVSDLRDDELVDKALISLAAILDKTVSELRDRLTAAHVFNWQKETAVEGGYSYATPRTSTARTFLQHPVGDTIFFSGEGIYEGSSPGTVEAAIIQAKKTALQVLQRVIPNKGKEG